MMVCLAAIGLGAVAAAEGRDEPAVAVLSSLRADPQTPAPHAEIIDRVLNDLAKRVAEDAFRSAAAHGRSLDSDALRGLLGES